MININKIFPVPSMPIAVVNGELVTQDDLDQTMKTIPEEYREFLDDDLILNQTIMNILLLQEAKKMNLEASDEDIKEIIEESIVTAQITDKEFEEYLKEQDLTMEDMEEFYKIHLSIENLLEATIYKDIEISFEEIQAFYNENSEELDFELDEVKDQIEQFLIQKAQTEALNEYILVLIETSEIEIFEQELTKEVDFSSEEVEKYSNCALEKGLEKGTVVFVYTDTCPHCKKVKPAVTELGEEYSFYWANAADSSARTLLNDCFKDVLAGGVPQFICSKNGANIVGERPKEVLEEFAKSCI